MSGLRIISGSAKGRRLRSVPGETTRPITDRTKESLFNILGADIEGANFLDLFAGTGSVGIEALSRGALFARFIDNQRNAIKTIQQNLQATGLEKFAEVIHKDAYKYLEQIPDKIFEYVYIAPPQYKQLWKRALLMVDTKSGWLAPDAWIIVQIHPVEFVPLNLKNTSEFDRRQYGSTLLVFYERTPLKKGT